MIMKIVLVLSGAVIGAAMVRMVQREQERIDWLGDFDRQLFDGTGVNHRLKPVVARRWHLDRSTRARWEWS